MESETISDLCASTAQRGALPTDTLADIGTAVISARDLLERLELMPFPGKDHPAQHDSAKMLALRALVAEKLLLDI
jgi:hypothetical protein